MRTVNKLAIIYLTLYFDLVGLLPLGLGLYIFGKNKTQQVFGVFVSIGSITVFVTILIVLAIIQYYKDSRQPHYNLIVN